MDIEIFSGNAKAIVSRDGAWLTNLSDENGDVLYPKRSLVAADGSQKIRGGCHVCLPNFGPGGATGLAQHGFGRTSVWDLAGQSENTVSLVLHGGEGLYGKLESQLTYTIVNATITLELEVKNMGAEPLHIAPGFHPYFALQPDETAVEVENEIHQLSEISGTEYRDGLSKKLVTKNRSINLAGQNLSTWAIWTDQLGNYVCIEPTFAGNAFLQEDPAEGDWLEPQASAKYSCTISW